jgi:hypothetical protein
MALVFVDVVDFSGNSGSDFDGFSAGSTASRQSDSTAGGGTTAESSKAPDAAGAAEPAGGVGSDSGGAAATGPADDPASGNDGESEPPAIGALAPQPEPTGEEASTGEDASTLAVEADEDVAVADSAAQEPDVDDGAASATNVAVDDSGGISTLRALEIVAALAFVASLGVVFLPALRRREER